MHRNKGLKDDTVLMLERAVGRGDCQEVYRINSIASKGTIKPSSGVRDI